MKSSESLAANNCGIEFTSRGYPQLQRQPLIPL